MEICCIVAATEGTNGIGLKGVLPWSLPNEFKYFINTTCQVKDEKKKNAVIMGRKCWAEIKKPLKNRLNIVLSRNKDFIIENSEVKQCKSLSESLDFIKTLDNIERIFILGGTELYKEALDHPQCKKIYYTRIFKQFECDTFFPKIDESKWMLDESYHENETIVENGVPYKFQLYVKKHEEYQYLNLIKHVMQKGVEKMDRTGTGTFGVFGSQMRYDLRNQFPLLTTKRVFWKGVVEELLWFIQGNTNGNDLSSKGVKIWEGNGSREYLDSRGLKDREVGDLGPVYGFQWRFWGAEYKDFKTDYKGKGIDQLKSCIDLIKNDPSSRRIVMSAWNPSDLDKMALPPCHMFCQFFVANGELSCMMYQRSCDLGLGVPFNIASYSLLTYMVAHVCGLKPGEFIHVLGDCHVYKNHVESLKEQITRTPNDFPKLILKTEAKNIDEFKFEDFVLEGYNPQSTIKMKMAI